jgi:hypothetical protein
MVDGEANRRSTTARWAAVVGFGVSGVLLLVWGVIVLVSKAGLLQGWLVAVPLAAASVWLLRRSAAVAAPSTAGR